jgi:hypothetical protein
MEKKINEVFNMEEKEQIRQSITVWRNARRAAQKRWSGVHHLSLFGSIICSVIATAQIQIFNHSDIASLLTAIAAVLTGIAASGGFERKWRSNRLSRSKGDCLLIDIMSENADLNEIKRQYKLAIEKHDLEIVGDKNEDNG